MPLDEPVGLRAAGGDAGLHRVPEGALEADNGVGDGPPLLRPARGRAFGVVLPLRRVSVALTGLGGPVRVPPGAEDRRLLLGGQQQAALVGVDHPVQSGAELLEAVDPFGDPGALRAQRVGHVHGRIVQDGPDRLQAETDLAVDDDAVQTFQITSGVEPVSGGRAQRRPRQSDLVPVVQRADCHAQTRGDLTDGQAIDVSDIGHASHCPPRSAPGGMSPTASRGRASRPAEAKGRTAVKTVHAFSGWSPPHRRRSGDTPVDRVGPRRATGPDRGADLAEQRRETDAHRRPLLRNASRRDERHVPETPTGADAAARRRRRTARGA
ncbi:hypothetical protein GCM10027294_49930 [Marinactinospora endophytica]